jgi:soluble lytic murein transglycosylase-like protein
MIWIVAGLLVYLVFVNTARGGSVTKPSYDKVYERATWHAQSRGLDPALVWGVILTESSANPLAKNPSDPSAGLMQVTPLIGRAFGGLQGTNAEVLALLLDVETNLRAGTGFLAHLQGRYGAAMQVGEWVQAYNLGETAFDKGVRNGIYGNRVLKNMGRY